MASVQDRLKLKRVPLDKWSISEQLYLASAVACSGDQNWMSVSRSLKLVCGANRPDDWFSQKSCAAQYGKLLENVETPKRKKRNEKDTSQTTVETPTESILRRLTHERIIELKKLINEERQEYNKIKEEIALIQSGSVDDVQMKDMWKQIEQEEKQREKEQQLHAQWLKEREERKKEIERQWKPNAFWQQQTSPNQSPSKSTHLNLKGKVEDMEVDDSNSRQGTSPLLTSLLKSPSPAPNPNTSILNQMNLGTSATRASAPTITNLLTGSLNNITTTLSTPVQKGTTSAASVPAFAHQLQTQPLTGPPTSDTAANNVVQSPSQSAPTLSMLLENKNRESIQKATPLTRFETQQLKQEAVSEVDAQKTDLIEGEMTGTESPIKDEDQQLMDVFNGLIPDDELADILTGNNAIILNPDLLEEDAILDNVADLMDGEDDQGTDAENKVFENQINVGELNVANNFQNDIAKSDNTVELTNQSHPQSQNQHEPLRQIEQQVQQEQSNQRNLVDQKVQEEQQQELKPEQEKLDEQINLEESIPEEDIKPGDEQKETISSLQQLQDEQVDDDVKDDESSDLSNDTPLSELAKEVKSQNEQAAKEAQVAREEPDTFESDSNDDKSLESIKREIQCLSELKENSSENSSEVPEPKVEQIPATTVKVEQSEPIAVKIEEPEITEEEPNINKEIASETNQADMKEVKEEAKPIEEESVENPAKDAQQVELTTENNDQAADTERKEEKEEDAQNTEEHSEDKRSPDSVEIVEIKDDRSEDDNKESIILIEEADDANSKEVEEIEPKTEYEFTFKLDDTDDVEIVSDQPAIADENVPSVPDHRLSSDEEVFEDAKESVDELKNEDEETNVESETVQNTISLIDTDDDSPMEVIKEDKAGRTKRDYSRKKQESTPSTDKRYDEATSSEEISNISTRMKLKDRDRSESPYCDDECSEPKSKRRYSSTPVIDSLPNSPASSDDREYRSWKKSILIVYSRLISHKNASLFAKPITEEQAPNYKNIVLHPGDLQTLKRNIENGSIRSTAEFQRYVMIMCYNALFYNNDQYTCIRAKEMLHDAISLIDDIMDTWRKENEKSASSSSSSATKIVRGRKSNRLLG